MDNELKIAIDEIESYHGVKLTELLMRLAKNPLVRHFKGNVYRVIGVGRDCVTDVPQVIYSPLDGSVGVFWTRELVNFLSPIDPDREDNVTGQKRRFEFVENMITQLDLVKDEDLIKELERRSDDMTIIKNDNILSDDWVIARVVRNPETNELSIYDVQNYFATKEQAEENLERNRRHRKLLSLDYTILHRIFTI